MACTKRKRRENDERTTKRPNDTETTTTLPTLKLTELNEDVLVEIFSYLNAEQLINMVKADEIFLSSSGQAFRKIYYTKYIQLPFQKTGITSKMDFQRNSDLLRYFGESISKLEFEMNEDNPTEYRIYHLIITNCRETLTELKILCPSTKLKMIKSFTKLKTLNICNGVADRTLCQVPKWFPVLQNLIINGVTNISPVLSQEIKSLKSFSMDFTHHFDHKYYKYHIQNFNRFIDLNPQLNELCLTMDDDMIMTEKFISFSSTSNRLQDNIHQPAAESMTVKLILPFNMWSSVNTASLAQLKIPFDRIERLEFTTAMFTAQICGFAANCKNLKTLKLTVTRHVNSEFLSKFESLAWTRTSECLTHLELSIALFFYEDYANISLTIIRCYLKQHKNLKMLKFTVRKFGDTVKLPLPTIRAKIDLNLWTISQQVMQNDILQSVITFTLNKL